MAVSDWFRGRTPLQTALERGLKEGGQLAQEIDELGDYTVKCQADGEAICDALQKLVDGQVPRGKSLTSPLHSLVGFFQEVKGPDCAAFRVLFERGTPLLASIVNNSLEGVEEHEDSDLLFLLKILAMYGSDEGADTIIRAANKPLASGGYLWSVVFGMFTRDHPQTERVFAALTDPLPLRFIGMSLLDAANRIYIDGGHLRQHPFDSDGGVQRLEQWLSDPSPAQFSYAVSATAALPFLNHTVGGRLRTLAMRHPDLHVQMEAAWAAAKLGHTDGIEKLRQMCLDVNHASQAKRYLEELDRSADIPPASSEPNFVARAEFAGWLAHPNELGRAPDSLDVIDHRSLKWPPEFEPKPFWLLRYVAKDLCGLDDDDVGLGLVGSITFSLFSCELDQRAPEDAYAVHCCWEMEHHKLYQDEEVDDDSTEYDSLLCQWPGDSLTNPRVAYVAELDSKLRHPRGLVALASAQLKGIDGWAVLDGPDSRFYPADEFPPDQSASIVLRIHIGRRLLAFPDIQPRKPWLTPKATRTPEQFIEAYEKLLAELGPHAGSLPEPAKSKYEKLGHNLERYVDALFAVRGHHDRNSHLVAAYEKLWEIAHKTQGSLGKDSFDSHSPVGNNFDQYIDALVKLGRSQEIPPLVAFLAPKWQHNLGYGLLGTAAFKAGDWETAANFFLSLKEGLEEWTRCDEMDLLAEIWVQRGKPSEARALLLDCLKGTLADSRDATGSDRPLYEQAFQARRRTFLRLFPNSASDLASQDIPETTLSSRR